MRATASLRTPSPLPGSEVQEKQQLAVDTEPVGALLFEEVGNLIAADEVNLDVLMLIAPAFADLLDSVRSDDREPLGQHSGGSVEFSEPLHALGGKAGLLFKLVDRGSLD